MPISYDKKALKKSLKYIKMGKKKYAVRLAFYGALFQAVFLPLFLLLLKGKFDWKEFGLNFLIFFIVMFIVGYFSSLKTWDNMYNLYHESIEHFKEKDPEFISDLTK